jgi:uncharacterized protein (DUF58 family)
MSWRLTAAGFRAPLVGVAGLVAAVTFRRPDVLVVVTPFVVVAAWAWWRRPTQPPAVRSIVAQDELREGEVSRWHVEVAPAAGAEDICVGLAAGEFLMLDPASGAKMVAAAEVRADRSSGQRKPIDIGIAFRATRWGVHALGPCAIGLSSAWAAYQAGPHETRLPSVTVLPLPAVFDAGVRMPAPRGLVGLDRSRRAGAGTEFHSLRLFQTGDRLRRIHWPSSLRTGSLLVSQTHADEESQVVLCIDATSDLGQREGIDGRPTSLDLTLRAAAAVAEHHLGRGDRVIVRVFGDRGFPRLPARTGVGQMRILLRVLARVEPATDRRVDAVRVTSRLPAEALVLVFSPMVSQASVAVVGRLAAAGMSTVVVDTLPDHLGTTGTEWSDLAWRLRRVTRRAELERLGRRGVPVVPWRGSGSLDAVLRALAVRARAPRVTFW